MSYEHKTLRDEILFVLGRASAPLTGAEIYERAKLADEMKQVSKALNALKGDEKIVRVEGEGRARYRLADGQRAPAPAGKAGRSKAIQADDARTTELPTLDLPLTIGFGYSLNGAAGKTQRANPEIDISHIDTPNLADAMIAVSREQLTPGVEVEPAWWIDKDGCLEVADSGDTTLLIQFTRAQAQRLAAVVMAVHDELGPA